jgi:hypothetical protein
LPFRPTPWGNADDVDRGCAALVALIAVAACGSITGGDTEVMVIGQIVVIERQ